MTTGLDAHFRVRNGRYVAEQFPAGADPDAGAPTPDAGVPTLPPVIAVVQTSNLQVREGQRGKEFAGSVSFNARTVAVGLSGDRGYWIVPVEAPDIDLPPNLAFRAVADFANDVPPGPLTVLFAGIDADGRVGPRRALPIEMRPALPDAPLAVVLDWDRDFDLDLVVYQPDGTALTYHGIRTPEGAYHRATADGPRIDVDSNAGCRIDGIRQEAATFPAPLAGHYEVRIRLFAPCGEPMTNWRVRVVRSGTVVTETRGSTYAIEADAPGGGPTDDGRRALVFEIAR